MNIIPLRLGARWLNPLAKMSYCEQNGEVILSISREDYQSVLLLLSLGTMRYGGGLDRALEVIDRINRGNPHYTPYQVRSKRSTSRAGRPEIP